MTILIGIVFIGFGIASLVKPDFNYRLQRMQYRNSDAWEPSTAGLVMARVFGAIFLVVGVAAIAYALAHWGH